VYIFFLKKIEYKGEETDVLKTLKIKEHFVTSDTASESSPKTIQITLPEFLLNIKQFCNYFFIYIVKKR